MMLPAIDAEGWVAGVRRVSSPNFDARPEGAVVDLAVVHAISLPPGKFGSDDIVDLFLNRLDPALDPYFAGICHLRVSAHFLIRRDGELIQFVSCNDRAWHAGVSSWAGRERCNDFSVGIELEGCDEQPFDRLQYAVLRELLAALCCRYPLRDLSGHSEIAPGRKTDPGPNFDWSQLSSVPLKRPS